MMSSDISRVHAATTTGIRVVGTTGTEAIDIDSLEIVEGMTAMAGWEAMVDWEEGEGDTMTTTRR